MRLRKRYAIVPAALLLTLAACSTGTSSSANKVEQQAQASIQQQYELGQPIPKFNWSQIRQTVIEIETAQANTTQTTSFFFNLGVQHPVFVCPSVGFPVASTTELTNPQQVVNGYDNGNISSTTVGQMDPNGVYTGDSSGTYVLCVDNQGRTYAHYAEEFVHTVSGAAQWNDQQQQIVVTGAPTGGFTNGKN